MDELYHMSQRIDDQFIKESKISRTNFIDPTLQLPDHVLHSIFSYLTSQDLVHVRLVSKRWHQNSPSCFLFDLDQSLFFRERLPFSILQELPNEYMDWVHFSLETSKTMLTKAERRILRVQFYDYENVYDVMKLMDGNKFHEVYLRFEDHPWHNLLTYMFQSTCLTVVVLHLTQCELDEHLFHGKEKFDSLRELKLDGVRLSGETLTKFISKCPNIRELRLVNCELLTSIVLPKLDRLKEFYVKFLTPYPSITNVQIIAPSLQVFHFVYRNQSKVDVNMDVRACRMLHEFQLDCLKFPDGLDHENFCSDFPHLETLLMGPCVTRKLVKISSPTLKTLILFFTRLYDCSRTRVVFAPNLSSYEYTGTTFKPFLDPSDAPKLLETKIELAYNVEKINRVWFLKLRRHLKYFTNNIILSLCIRDEETSSSHQDKGENLWSKLIGRAPTYPLHHIKHVLLDMNKLKLSTQEYSMKYIIDSLFWMSHPDTLTLSIPYKLVALLNEVCEELRSRKEGNCCFGTMEKCWRHFLKDFEIHEKMASEKKKLKFVFKLTWQFIS